MNILKIIFLLVAVLFTLYNTSSLFYGKDLPLGNLVWQTVGIVGFIILQLNLLS